ncbi:MAG: hypothetical protein HYR84_13170, partial [Planctomycetes bacterium]|nr:hypothetical protein [Planctomycetota bacterium]
QRMNADGVALCGEFTLNVIDGQILFTQSNGAFADQIANRSLFGAWTWHNEKGRAFAGNVTELMAENAKGAGGAAEAPRNLCGRKLVEEVSTQRLVLAVRRRLGDREELSGLKIC